MWRPTSWHDLVLALGQRHEDQQLDFKRQLPNNARDLAKDAAAMSIDGGVIVIGVDENAGVASAIHPLPLHGVVERLRQLIDSHVEPMLEVEISVLRDNPNDGDGVVVITVPKSESGPHQYDGRFPARSGPTTRYLGASEVAALYAGGATETAESSNPIDEFVSPPGAGTGGFVGIGRMKLQVLPAREFQHPDQPRLGPALGAAVAATAEQIDDFVDPHLTPATLDWLQRWTPRSSAWTAGEASDQFETLRANRLVAATYSYGGGFSFYSTMGLMPEGMDWRCTYENLWAAEALAQLAVAAHFFEPLDDRLRLRVGLELHGLEGSVSSYVTHAEIYSPTAPKVGDTVYSASGEYRVTNLATDPRDAVRELLDPLFITIVDQHHDVVAALKRH